MLKALASLSLLSIVAGSIIMGMNFGWQIGLGIYLIAWGMLPIHRK